MAKCTQGAPTSRVESRMAKSGRVCRTFGYVLVVGSFAGVSAACAATTGEPARAKLVASHRIQCADRDQLHAGLNRKTPLVREWIVGCDFMYIRVHCTNEGCYPAEARPPCVEGVECLVEDPVTLEWKLAEQAPIRSARVQ